MPWRRERRGNNPNWMREGETIQTPPNFACLHLKGVGGVTVEELMPAPDGSCRVGGCGAKRGEGGKKRRKVSSYLALNGIVLT